LTPVKITPTPASQDSDFEFVVPADTTTTSLTTQVEYAIGVQKVNDDSSLVAFDIEGTFVSYQVIITSSDDTQRGPLADVDGVTSFLPGDKHEFDMITGKLNEDDEIKIVITGPSSGFNVNITEFIICLPEFKYCQLTYQDVIAQLPYEPLNRILGSSEDDNQEVYYSQLNMTDGDILEEGVKVFGACYVCECIDMKLQCEIDPYCKCPNYTARCEGDCYNATLIVDFDTAGVDPSCYPNDTCTPDECTTPWNCPTEWGEWSYCADCVRTRNRVCEGANCDCTNITTTESEICDNCATTEMTPTTSQPTTPYCDEENEKWDCYNHYIMCNESCRTLMNRDRCESLNRTDEDMPCNYSCMCIDGYKRNQAGDCVKEEECECYNGTIPLPFGYKENVSECRYCECKMNVGYVCTDIPNCNQTCTPNEWEEWSPCSASCDNGTRVRTRTTQGADCTNTTTVEEEICAEVPCPNETCQRTLVEEKKLTFNDTIYGLCVSDDLPVHKCIGHCKFSRSGGKHYAYKNPNSDEYMFDLDYFSDCECCQATMESKPVQFTCGPNDVVVKVDVTSITACDCMQCR